LVKAISNPEMRGKVSANTIGPMGEKNSPFGDTAGSLHPKSRHRKGRHNRTWSCPSALKNSSWDDKEAFSELMTGIQYAHTFLTSSNTDIFNNAASVAKVLDSLSYLSKLGAESGKEKKSPTTDQFPNLDVLKGTSAAYTRRRNLSGDATLFNAGFSAGTTFDAPGYNDIHPLLRPQTQQQQTDLPQDLHSSLSNNLDHIHPLQTTQKTLDSTGNGAKSAADMNLISGKKPSRHRKRNQLPLSPIFELNNDQGAVDIND